MRLEWLRLLRCPDDGTSPLLLYPVSMLEDGTVTSGGLECPACHRLYAIRGGIACLMPRALAEEERAGLPDELPSQVAAAERASREGGDRLPVADMLSEIRARDREVDDYEARYHSRAHRHEIATCVGRLSPRTHETILDLGCGTGRVTRAYLERSSLVVGADFSLDSLAYLAAHVAPALRARLFLVRCEAAHLPFADGAFDAALATSVYSHVPTAATRAAGLAEVHRVLAAGGRLLVTVYNHCWTKRLRQRLGLVAAGSKEGYHTNGEIHYYNFEQNELEHWISERFESDRCFGLDHRLPLLSNLSPALAEAIDRVLGHAPWSRRLFATEIGAVAYKR